HDTTTLARYVPDLAKDKFHVWITKYHYVPMIVLGLVLLVLGGLPFLLWGIFVRTVVGLHSTWMVNSITHTWGSRRFVTHDLSTFASLRVRMTVPPLFSPTLPPT